MVFCVLQGWSGLWLPFWVKLGWCVDRCSTWFSFPTSIPWSASFFLGYIILFPSFSCFTPLGLPSFPFFCGCSRWFTLVVVLVLAIQKPLLIVCDFPLVFTRLYLVVLHRCVHNMYVSPTTKLRHAYKRKHADVCFSFWAFSAWRYKFFVSYPFGYLDFISSHHPQLEQRKAC